MFCCYIYTDPRLQKLEAIYVGKGHLNRPQVHLEKGSHHKLFARKLAKIKAAGLITKCEDAKNKMSATALERSPSQYEKIAASRIKTLAERKSAKRKAFLKIERKCEVCNTSHFGEYGSGRFCSVKCVRGFATMVSRNILLKEKEIESPLSIID